MIVFIIFLSLFFIFVLLNIMIGSVMIQPKEIFHLLLGHGGNETSYGILWKVRFPRMIAAVLLGGALSLSGFLLQTFFNNPIAGPFVLGISSGAKLVVAFIMVLTLSRSQAVHSIVLVMSAFIGAMGSMGFVLLMSQIVRQSSMLIVSGVMIGYICSAITDFIVTFADDASIVNLHNWSLGSFSGTAWADIQVIAVVVITASVLVFLLSKPIGAYQLGESYAQNMGVNIKAFRILIVILSSLLSACVTAFAGPISFVGIAVPHLVKSFLKTAKPLIVIPMCFLGGAIFCLGCDLAARTIFAPVELSISSVTALIGAPVVIGILLKKKGHG